MTSTTTDGGATQLPRKGRSNAIVTYATLEQLLLEIQETSKVASRLDTKMDHLYEKVHDIRSGYSDHEVRIRSLELALAKAQDHEARVKALELSIASSSASRETATWLWQAVWPAAAVIIAVLSYLNQLGP